MAGDLSVRADMVDADEHHAPLNNKTRLGFGMALRVEHDGAPLDGSIHPRNVGPTSVGVTVFHRQRHHGSRRLMAQREPDYCLLQLVTADSLKCDFNDSCLGMEVGDICIFDPAQMPMSQIEAEPVMSIAISRQALAKAVGSRDLHGIVLKAGEAMTSLIASVLHGLRSLEAPLSDRQAMAAQEAAVVLLTAALKGEVQRDAACFSPLGAGLHQRIVQFITRNIHLPELSPDFLCRYFKVSRAHLYRAFANEGGVAKVLRNIRLDAAYRELTQPARNSRSITEIAYSLGFSSGNQLLRTFRSRFGMTPSEARTSGQG